MLKIKNVIAIIIIAVYIFSIAVVQGQEQGPGGAPTSEKGAQGAKAAAGGGGRRTVDFDNLIKTLQDAKNKKPAKFEELQKLLYIKPFTTEEYDANLTMGLGIIGNTTLNRNDNIKIYAYLENPNPIEIRRAEYLFLEALEPGEKSFRQVNSVPQIIQVNEYEDSGNNVNSTTRIFPELTSFSYLKRPGQVLLRFKASDGVYELYSENKTLNITNNPPNLSGFMIDAPSRPRYNDPISYVANVTDVDGDMVNITLHVLNGEEKNATLLVKAGDKAVFKANEYGFFTKDDAGKNFTYYYTYDDGVDANKTERLAGPNLRKSVTLSVAKPLVVPEDENQYWWQNYNFSVNMKNMEEGIARVSVSLFTDTEAHPWKIVDTKDVDVGQEMNPVYFNVKPFDVLDVGKNFSFKIKYSEFDQDQKDFVQMISPKAINQKLLKYDIASLPIALNLFAILSIAILLGIFFERRFYR
ncbi:MAG: hypothetical protein LUQ38_02025 [Methanotrichaceae archaeon]|nr:hypothetical protein [Methanotrichaceae archaeon]